LDEAAEYGERIAIDGGKEEGSDPLKTGGSAGKKN
jgi:hypothetical protein